RNTHRIDTLPGARAPPFTLISRRGKSLVRKWKGDKSEVHYQSVISRSSGAIHSMNSLIAGFV
ncbi:hypothetical protein PIB30_109298, partial [Stylosanthes scabra]|nr:hypothetical protein [Stylosanthes scabra]